MTAEAPVRKPRGFLIAISIVFILFILAIAALYFLPYFLPIVTIRSIAKEQARDNAGVDLDFESLGFSWTGGLVLEGISIAPIAAEGQEPQQPLASVDKVHVSVSWLALLKGKIIINSVDVDGFAARLKREADGSLNLPKIPENSESETAAQPESAPENESSSDSVMALVSTVELHAINLNNGVISFEDAVSGLAADIGVPNFTVEGATLNDEFTFAGEIIPFQSSADGGAITISGNARLVKDFAFDPDGQAKVVVNLESLPLNQYAASLDLGRLLPSGGLDGNISLAYDAGAAQGEITDIVVKNLSLGLGDKALTLPDTTLSVAAALDQADDRINISGLKLDSSFETINGNGWIGGISSIVDGKNPFGEIDFTGLVKVEQALHLFSDFIPDKTVIPDSVGDVGFTGKLALDNVSDTDNTLSAMATMQFNSGEVSISDIVPDATIATNLAAIGFKAVAKFSDPLDINATVNLNNLPVQISHKELQSNIVAGITGGAAVQLTGPRLLAELRMQQATIDIPESPWTKPMKIQSPEAKIVFDSQQDAVEITGARLVINETINAGIRTGQFKGIMAGDPSGSVDAELSLPLPAARDLFGPLVPAGIAVANGALRSAARVALQSGKLELGVNSEFTSLSVSLTEPEVRAALEMPKTSVGLSGLANLDDLTKFTVSALTLNNAGVVAQAADGKGNAASARLGETIVTSAGFVDLNSMELHLSAFDVKSGGMTSAISKNDVQTASLNSGAWMFRSAATQEAPLVFPLLGEGNFVLPQIETGVDNLVFRTDAESEESNLGNIRLKLDALGFLGETVGDKYSHVTINKVEFLAAPVAAQAKGLLRLDNLTAEMEYAARFAPARMGSVLKYLQIPPELLNSAEVSGRFSWNGTDLTSAGMAKGGLQFTEGSISPFSVSYDFTATISKEARTLQVAMRSLNGSVTNANGEAIISMVGQPSTLVLGRNSAQGFIDLRVNGAAAPTRMMLLGFTSLVPELHDFAQFLATTQADGAFQTWIQLQGRDNQSAQLNVGGIWQGAALRVGDTQLLAEPGWLGGALVCEYNFSQYRFNITQLSFNSDSAQIRAEGNAGAVIQLDSQGQFTGLTDIMADLRFALGDLTRISAVFPGIMPPELGFVGKVDGQFKASGDTTNLRIDEGTVHFTGIQGQPGGMTLSIPNGAATYGGTFSINPPGTFDSQGSDFAILRAFNMVDGQASLSGAQVKGRNVSNLSATFTLQGGQFQLGSARLTLAGEPEGNLQAAGVIDFNGVDPAINLQVGITSMPLAQLGTELAEFLTIHSGWVNVPAQAGGLASIGFTGFSEDAILQTLTTNNLTFTTGQVVLSTGPLINAELDRARLLLQQEAKGDNSDDRVFSFQSISGSILADGSGVIAFPKDAPIRVIGDNTGNFLIQGEVRSDHTLNLEVWLAGQLEKILAFSLPNIIPNLSQQSQEERNLFMARLNQNAEAGHYKLRIVGTFEHPEIAGIPQLVTRILTDIPLAAPFGIIGGIFNLGKDAPGAILNAPQNISGGIGNIIGAIANPGGSNDASGQQQQQQQQQENQQPDGLLPGLFRGLR